MDVLDDKSQSFFDCIDQLNPQKTIWESLKNCQLQDDIIEFKVECYKVCIGKKILKSISLAIGESTLYYVQNNIPTRMIPLLLVKITTMKYEESTIIRLSRNKKQIEFKVTDTDQFINLLKKKCIQTSFHEDFVVEKKIGKGAFACVYQAIKKETGEKVAVKVFNKQQVQLQSKGKDSLINEIRIMRTLNQPSIINLHEVHETENSIYMVMNLLEGGELFERMKKYNYSQTELQQIMYNILKALHYMHQRKCLHRDLKPQNILLKNLDNNVDIVIADLGLATYVDEIPIYKRCGTAGFVAPEVLKYEKGQNFYNEKCDIFSVGAIFYWLTTGKQLFKGEDRLATLEKNEKCFINFSAKEILKAPKSLQSILRKMLRVLPQHRHSAEQCLQHRYFKEIFKPEDLLEFQIEQMPIQQEIFNSEKGSFELVTKDQQWNGKAETIGSSSNNSLKSSKNEKKQPNLSRFAQFCQDMQQFQKSNPKKKNQESLHKLALKNSLRKQNSKEDNEVSSEDVNPKGPLGKFLKKCNSLDA